MQTCHVAQCGGVPHGTFDSSDFRFDFRIDEEAAILVYLKKKIFYLRRVAKCKKQFAVNLIKKDFGEGRWSEWRGSEKNPRAKYTEIC